MRRSRRVQCAPAACAFEPAGSSLVRRRIVSLDRGTPDVVYFDLCGGVDAFHRFSRLSDLVYSSSLVVAWLSAGLALLLGIVAAVRRASAARARQPVPAPRPRAIPAALGALLVGASSLVVSVAVHWRSGHGPTAAEPMDVSQFLSEHEAFPLAAFALIAGLAVVTYAAARKRP